MVEGVTEGPEGEVEGMAEGIGSGSCLGHSKHQWSHNIPIRCSRDHLGKVHRLLVPHTAVLHPHEGGEARGEGERISWVLVVFSWLVYFLVWVWRNG